MIVLGLTGPAGCGKSTLARYLVQNHDFVELAFADPLRDMLAALLELPRLELDHLLADRDWKESPLPSIGASPRRLLQTLGTEWGREQIGADIWLRIARERMEKYFTRLRGEYAGIVFSDVRFENEAAFIRARGLLLHIARPDLTPVNGHASENGVAMHHRDQLVLNHSIELLHQQADRWVRDLGWRHDAA